MSGTLCAAVSPKLGRTGLCNEKALWGKPKIAYFVKSTFTPSFENFLLEATFKTGVKAETVFPVAFDDLEWNDVEAGVWTSGTGIQYKTTDRKHVAVMKVNASTCLKTELIKLANFKGGLMIGYDKQYLRGCSIEDNKVIGMRIEKIIYMGEEQQGTNSDDPSKLIFHILFSTEKDLVDYSYVREMTWIPANLDGIHNYTITILNASTTSISFSVHIDCDGYYVPVEGLAVVDLNTTVGDGTITGLAESTTTAGNYTATPTSPGVFSSGTLALLGTSALGTAPSTYTEMALAGNAAEVAIGS